MKNWPLIVLVVTLCTGCASGFSERNTDGAKITNHAALDLIGKDLMSVMHQILDARKTTLQYSDGTSYFSDIIYKEFRARGFGLQKVSADQGLNYIFHEEKVSGNSGGRQQYLYKVTVGSISVERNYVDNGWAGVFPVSPLKVTGTVKVAVPDPTLFRMSKDQQFNLNRVNYASNDPTLMSVPRITYITDELLTELSTGEDLLPVETAKNSSNLSIKNLYFTNESNFADMTSAYDLVRRSIIVFDNDSIRLGPYGKRKVRNLFQSYNHKTDLISLLGCSNGHTDLDMGNQGLALGRSRRVLEEFRDLGVPKAGLLDEGCWSGDHLDGRYPRRGVVVELKRRRS